jgi:hypothetical protein
MYIGCGWQVGRATYASAPNYQTIRYHVLKGLQMIEESARDDKAPSG